MKKLLVLLASLSLLSGCDDGDMTFRSFNFTNQSALQCGEDSNILFKINGTEVLILNIDLDTALQNVVTPDDTPRTVTVSASGTNRIYYRNYSATATQATLCSAIPPTSPSVIEEWLGDGVLEIETDAILDEDNRVTGYSHNITLRSITFTKQGSQEQVTITDNNFGSIQRTLGFDFDFESTTAAPITLQNCSSTGPFYSLDGTEAIVLSLEPEIVAATTGTETIDLEDSTDDNTLFLRVFGSSISSTSICGSNPPITPVETQRWSAEEGTIEIVTTLSNGAYVHTVHLKNVVFYNTSNSGETYSPVPFADFVIGSFTTTE